MTKYLISKKVNAWSLTFVLIFFYSAIHAQQQTHSVPFETSNGIYGKILIKTKPHNLGNGYVIADAEKLVIEGVRGETKVDGFSFPLSVNKFTLNVSGQGCMYLNSSQPYCGNFAIRYLSSATSDYTEVGFSQDVRELHNKMRKSEGGEGKWQTSGFVRDVAVSNVTSETFSKIMRAISESKAEEIATSEREVTNNSDADGERDNISGNKESDSDNDRGYESNSREENSSSTSSKGSSRVEETSAELQRKAGADRRAKRKLFEGDTQGAVKNIRELECMKKLL